MVLDDCQRHHSGEQSHATPVHVPAFPSLSFYSLAFPHLELSARVVLLAQLLRFLESRKITPADRPARFAFGFGSLCRHGGMHG